MASARLIVTAVLGVTLPTCAPSAEYAAYEMPTLIARPVHPIGDQNIAWIDKDRVLFEGLDRKLADPVERRKGVTSPMRRLYIWDWHKNEVVPYTRDALRSALCFADGFLTYSVFRDGKTIRLQGSFEHEQELPEVTDYQRAINRYTCKPYERSALPEPTIGGGLEPLRPEHGWIEHTGKSTWLRAPDGTLTQLSYEGKPIGTVRPQKYSHYAGGYVFWQSSQLTWLIQPNGMVLKQPRPSGSPNEGRLEPAAEGKTLLRSSQLNVREAWDPGKAGLYLYDVAAKSSERLLVGIVRAMQVHSDGCLVAAIVDPWDREDREQHLKVINLCQGR